MCDKRRSRSDTHYARIYTGKRASSVSRDTSEWLCEYRIVTWSFNTLGPSTPALIVYFARSGILYTVAVPEETLRGILAVMRSCKSRRILGICYWLSKLSNETTDQQ